MKEGESKKDRNAINVAKSVLNFVGISTFIGILMFLYNGFLKQPQIRCVIQGDEKTFFVKDDFRSVFMKLHPQLVIRFDDEIILLIYLEKYYEEELLYFDGNKECTAIMAHTEYVEELQKYMKEEIVSYVCLNNSKVSEKEINEKLHIYVNTLGGVQYESEQGNKRKRYCITEQDGIVIDYDEWDDEIFHRLCEANLVMKDDFTEMKTDEEIKKLIQGIEEKIICIAKEKEQ